MDEYKDVRRVHATTDSELSSALKTKMIGFSEENNSLGYKKPNGYLETFPANGSDATFNSVKIEGLATGSNQHIGIDPDGDIVVMPTAGENITLNTIPVGDGANGLVDSGVTIATDNTTASRVLTLATTVDSTTWYAGVVVDIKDSPIISNKVVLGSSRVLGGSGGEGNGIFGGTPDADGLVSGVSISNGAVSVRANEATGLIGFNKAPAHPNATLIEQSATLGQVHHVEAYGVHTAVKPVGSPFTKATRTFTIPANWQFHIAFEEFTAGTLSVVFPNVSGDYIVALNVATRTLSASTTFPDWGVGIPIARVWYSLTALDEINMSWENHGVRTLNDHNDATAKHHTVGMLAEISNRPLVIDGGQGTSVIGCTSGVLWDEDKMNPTSAKASDGTSAWAKFYFTGLTVAGAFDLRRFPADFGTATLAQIQKIFVTDVDLGIGATGRACFNNMSTGTPTMQAIASTSVMCIHQFHNDGILDTSALIIGQKEYTGANIAQAVQNARAGVASEIASIRMGEGAARDSVHIGTVIINSSGLKQWADDANTTTVIQPNQAGVSIGGTVVDHNSLTGRSSADAHPTSAITGLDTALAGRVDTTTDQSVAGVKTFSKMSAWQYTDSLGDRALNIRPDVTIGSNLPLGGINFWANNTMTVNRRSRLEAFTASFGNQIGLRVITHNTEAAGDITALTITPAGALLDVMSTASKTALADAKVLANFGDVKTLIGSAFTQMYSFGRVSFPMTGGNVDIPKVPVSEADVTQTFALRSGAKAPLACKITGFNITFLTQPADVNVYYKINNGSWILIGSVTVANGYATYLLGVPIQLAQNDFVRISYTGSNGESTGMDVDVFVREASL